MLHEQISHNPDVQKLVNDGYEVEIQAGYLILHRIPYVTRQKTIEFGKLMVPVVLEGQGLAQPQDHTAYFRGEHPCDDKGNPIMGVVLNSVQYNLATGLRADHQLSSKPESGAYDGYYHQMSRYAQVISQYARRIDPGMTAQPGKLTITQDPNNPFIYMDTASSRARITNLSERFAGDKIGIVGLGGTGSYILDYVSKTWVKEIHLFDGSKFQQHNAFRAPGAATESEIRKKWNKAELYANRYSEFRKGVIAHSEHITQSTIEEITEIGLDFVFVSVDDDIVRQWLLPELQKRNIPFIDVGMGIEEANEKLLGLIRTCISTPEGGHYEPYIKNLMAIEANEQEEERAYQRNIQLVELNALNAALAVIRWKKHKGFYIDQEEDLYSIYMLGLNRINNSGGLSENTEEI